MSELTGNNPNLGLVNINAYTKFSKILLICYQDMERKQNYNGMTDGMGQPKEGYKNLHVLKGYVNTVKYRGTLHAIHVCYL